MSETSSTADAAEDAPKEEKKLKRKRCQDNEETSKQEAEEEPQKATAVLIPFRDCSQDPIYKTLPNKSNPRGGGVGAMGHFPTILHNLLGRAESCHYDEIVSWRPHGRCFVVYDRSLFVQHIAPFFFKQTQFPSFQRQLHVYGLRCVSKKNADYGAYYHENFLRTRPDLCERMQRPTGRSKEDNTNEERPAKRLMDEPIFSKMTPMPPTTKAEMTGANNFTLPNLPGAAAPMSVSAARPGANTSSTPFSSYLSYMQAGGGGTNSSSNHPRYGNLMESSMGTSTPASANAIVDLTTAAATIQIPSPTSWHGNVLSNNMNNNISIWDMSNMAFSLQHQQQHGSIFAQTVTAPVLSHPLIPATVPVAGGGGGGTILENLMSAGLMTNNQHEQANVSGINNNNIQDMMAWLEPTPINPSVFSKKRPYVSSSSEGGLTTNMGNTAIGHESNSNHTLKTSSSDSQLLAMLHQQQGGYDGGGATAPSSLNRKRELFLQQPQRLQVVTDHQDTCGMAGFLSDVDLESDDHQHHRNLAPNHGSSSCLERQPSSSNSLSLVASPAPASQQQLQMHQEVIQHLLSQQQQQQQYANEKNYKMNG